MCEYYELALKFKKREIDERCLEKLVLKVSLTSTHRFSLQFFKTIKSSFYICDEFLWYMLSSKLCKKVITSKGDFEAEISKNGSFNFICNNIELIEIIRYSDPKTFVEYFIDV